MLAALAEVVLAAVVLVRFNVGGGMQFVTDRSWIPNYRAAPTCTTTSAWTGCRCSWSP